MALNSEAFNEGRHPGFENTALDGIRLSLDYIHKNRIKVVLNGGTLNPRGLALEVQKSVRTTTYLKVSDVLIHFTMPRAKL